MLRAFVIYGHSATQTSQGSRSSTNSEGVKTGCTSNRFSFANIAESVSLFSPAKSKLRTPRSNRNYERLQTMCPSHPTDHERKTVKRCQIIIESESVLRLKFCFKFFKVKFEMFLLFIEALILSPPSIFSALFNTFNGLSLLLVW